VIKASEEDLAAMSLAEPTLRSALRPEATLVITAGPRAVRAVGAFSEVSRAPRAVEAASAVGAGDAFTAGVLAELLAAGDEAGPAFWARAIRRGQALARRQVKPIRTKKRSARSTVGGEPSQGASTK
jgi:fructokinase